jgi:hypothetical protein
LVPPKKLLYDRYLYIEGNIKGRTEVTGRRRIRSKQLLKGLKERRGY